MNRGFTLIDLLVLVSLLAVLLLAGFLIPSHFLGSARINTFSMQNSTQLRGIHQSLMTYAQGNKQGSGVGYYPGLASDGTIQQPTVEQRLEILLQGSFFTPDYLINPNDPGKTSWQSGPLTPQNYSYALLQIDQPAGGGRRAEWTETLNTEAVVLSDRNTGTDAHSQVQSVWTNAPGHWRGAVTRNDGSTTFEPTHVATDTQYGAAAKNATDNLFEAAGADDALLIHAGK